MDTNQPSFKKKERDRAIAQLRALAANHRMAEARKLCLELTHAYERDTEIWMMRAGMHFQLGEYDSVVECCRQVILFDEKHAGAHYSLGLALHNLKRLHDAESAYRTAFRINPRYMQVVAQLIKLLMEQNRLAETREFLETAIAFNPQDGLLHYNLGLVLAGLGDRDAAIREFEATLRINPKLSEAHYQLGVLHCEGNQHDAAIESLARAALLDPNSPNALLKLAQSYVESLRIVDAIGIYERMITANPADADAHACLGMCHLLLGDFRHGWPEYQWRLKTNYIAAQPTNIPQWAGEPIEGKTILLLAEQGFGDAVQFVRYARMVRARGAKVILGCRPALGRLLAECEGVDQIVHEGERAPPFHAEATLLSLPAIFGTALDTIPSDVPYLFVPQGAGAQAVAEITRHAGVLRVGLVWAGGVYTKNRYRNLPVEHLRNFLEIPGIRFFSLQKGESVGQLEVIGRERITDLAPHLGDFADTAAAIQALDLVISVDTAVAHVAGALAKPVWNLIPFAPDWRWLLNREDSPWYPTMRLFRQPKPGDLSSVIVRVAAQLTSLAQQATAARGGLSVRS